jgi:hypothetical protein
MKKSELKKIIKEEIKEAINPLEEKDDFGLGIDFNPPSERNPSNKMIYDLLKEIKLLLSR